MSLESRLRDIAREAGLCGLGITSADRFHAEAAAAQERKDAGLHAGLGFTYRDPALAGDPRASFPWARCLVVGARAYLPDAGGPGPSSPGLGRVARFAESDHYRGLRQGLEAAARILRDAGHRAEVVFDDGRLLDRAAAARAGVGWWGRNTMILTPGQGPWLLIGSVVTDADLQCGSPMRRDCGTCDACIPACPTGALSDGVLDARLCLAMHLQAPGVIPAGIRPAVGDRVYGCDDCLEACPPGKRLMASGGRPRGRIDLIAMLGAADRTLMSRHGHWYVPRRQPRHLRRNALVALGNSGGAGAAAVAAGYLGHPDWLLRVHAAWAAGRLGGPAARAALRVARRRERHSGVIAEVEAALGTLS